MNAPARAVPVAAGHRWESLDALRGIAAFLVLTFHCAQISPGFSVRSNPLHLATWFEPWSWFKFTPLRLFVSSGPPSVVLFFVLSGFVLSLPFLRRQPGYGPFAIKRICRIYPPFAAAILVSAALYAWVQPTPMPGLSTWFNTVLWDRPLSLDYVVRNLMMTGIREDMTLDLVMWSLVHELRISLVFPLLFVLTRRWPAATLMATLLIAVGCTAALAGTDADGVITSLADTARFVPLFVAGILIASRVDAVRHAVSRLPGAIAAVLWVASVALMLAPGQSLSNYYNFVWGAGAVLLLVLTVGSGRADRVLSAAPLVWLGRVSYSLYLIHVPLLVAAVHLADAILPLWLTIALVIPLTLLAAELMYRAVEEPSIRLGRWLTAPRRAPAMPLMGPAAWRGPQ